jgi:hypothetical protein
MKRALWLFVAVLLCGSASLEAQTVTPYFAEFTASVDHSATENQVPVVSSYEVIIYSPGGVTAAATRDIGKPAPNASNVIRADITSTMTPLPASTNCNPSSPTLANCYTSIVKAKGPGGEGVSALSAPFTVGPRKPGAPSAPIVIRQ